MSVSCNAVLSRTMPRPFALAWKTSVQKRPTYPDGIATNLVSRNQVLAERLVSQ